MAEQPDTEHLTEVVTGLLPILLRALDALEQVQRHTRPGRFEQLAQTLEPFRTEMAAAIALLAPFPIDLLSINCATGPREMSEHIRLLGQSWPRAIGCFPNAGLPQLVDGLPSYPLTPNELADWLTRGDMHDVMGLLMMPLAIGFILLELWLLAKLTPTTR